MNSCLHNELETIPIQGKPCHSFTLPCYEHKHKHSKQDYCVQLESEKKGVFCLQTPLSATITQHPWQLNEYNKYGAVVQ